MTRAVAYPVEQAVAQLRKLSAHPPEAAFVLGSGAQVLADLSSSQTVSYEALFGIAPGVAGHAGSLNIGSLCGKQVAVLRGRFHLYEGHHWDVVTLATRVLAQWGVGNLFLTNAAGGINQSFCVGDLMVITGYLDLLNPGHKETGLLPALRAGKIDARNALTERLLAVGGALCIKDGSFRPLQKGVYAGLLGPSYETLAEIEMLKRVGADAVGMSTVPELQAAAATKMAVAAVSIITNVWSPSAPMGGHEEVLHAAAEASARLDKLFRAMLAET